MELAGDSAGALLLWALQEWESPGHYAGCSGGYQVGSGHTDGSASMFFEIPAPAVESWSQTAQVFMIPERKVTNLLHRELSSGFSHLLPTLVDVNKLVDLDLLCLDRKIYF